MAVELNTQMVDQEHVGTTSVKDGDKLEFLFFHGRWRVSASFLRSITDGIGHTPLVRLNRLSPPGGATIYGKAEFYNPGGSVPHLPEYDQ